MSLRDKMLAVIDDVNGSVAEREELRDPSSDGERRSSSDIRAQLLISIPTGHGIQ